MRFSASIIIEVVFSFSLDFSCCCYLPCLLPTFFLSLLELVSLCLSIINLSSLFSRKKVNYPSILIILLQDFVSVFFPGCVSLSFSLLAFPLKFSSPMMSLFFLLPLLPTITTIVGCFSVVSSSPYKRTRL